MTEAQNQRDSAIYYAQQALELDPDYPFALLTLSNLLIADKQYTAARSVIERYRNVRPTDVLPYGMLIEYALARDQIDSAYYFSLQALEVAPNHRLGYTTLALVYALKGQPDSAIATYEKMMATDDNPFTQVLGYRQIAQVHSSWGRFARALEYFSRVDAVASAAGLQDLQSVNHSQMAALYRDTDRLDDALDHYRKATELDVQELRGRVHQSRILARMGESDQALDIADGYATEWAGRVDSNELMSVKYEITALNHFTAGEYDEAVKDYLLIRKVVSDSTALPVSLAEAYLNAGQAEAAITELKAYRKDAEDGWPRGTYLKTLYLLGRAEVEAGHPENALEPLQRFLVFWGDADWDVPMINDAKNLYANLAAQ
jgi:tetratricopeptide (TPR) repeat protein